jgi:hypothetical protein
MVAWYPKSGFKIIGTVIEKINVFNPVFQQTNITCQQ